MEKLKLKDNILNQPFKTLSPGEQTKALLAAMFIDKNHFQLIDEPTNHLDILGRDIVSNYLKSKHGFIIVSHDKSFVNAIINHVLSIERTKIQLYKGNYTTWEHEFTQNNNSEAKRNKEIKDEIKQLNISAEKTKKWSNNSENKKFKKNYSEKNAHLDKGFLSHKASKLMQRRKNTLNHLNNDINEKSKLLKNIDKIIPLKLNYTQPYQKHLLTVKDLSVYNGSNVLNKSINFDLTRGMRLVIEGPNGVGKTTIIKSILSQDDIVYTGEINLNKKIKIAYLSQNLYGLEGYISDYAQKNNIEISNLLNTLRKLGFERSVFKQKLENLSMGQKRKVKLAKSLCQNANLYVWDEPLNYLDAITRDQIKNLILKYKPTMIIVEHDKDFINSIATQKIMLKKH
jgi:lincosamide and streptogramin A transport system ATP-binding/permease protein